MDRQSLEAQTRSWVTDLTTLVIEPLKECIEEDKRVVEITKAASEEAARQLTIGFLLLGVCGGIAGILWGLGMSRAIGRSMVQLNVSIRGASSKLSDLRGAVTVMHRGDLAGLEAGIKALELNVFSAVEQLQQRERDLLRSEQLARVGQLVAGMAHELRNPLMPMKMLVQAAIERRDDQSLRGRSLEVLNEEISRLEQSIQSLLDFARPPASK
jgi:signal transduction histidine kinase